MTTTSPHAATAAAVSSELVRRGPPQRLATSLHCTSLSVPLSTYAYFPVHPPPFVRSFHLYFLDPLMGTGNYSATSNNMKLVHWPLMGGLLHLVQR